MVLAYELVSGRLIGQIVTSPSPRAGFVRILSGSGYLDVHRSTISLEVLP